jgi:hypothetical protein
MLIKLLIALVVLGIAVVGALLAIEEQPTRPISAARDVEPTPGEGGEPDDEDDFDRPTNPAVLASASQVDGWRRDVLAVLDGPVRHAPARLRERVAAVVASVRARFAPVLLGEEPSATPVEPAVPTPAAEQDAAGVGGMTLDEVRAHIRQAHDTAGLPLLFGAGYAPQQPDEPVEDEPANGDDEQEDEQVPALVDDWQRGQFLIQGPPTQRAAFAAEVKTAVSPFDEDWMHSGMTGPLPRITADVIADQDARHDAAERPWEQPAVAA